jgi:hypothetical protein
MAYDLFTTSRRNKHPCCQLHAISKSLAEKQLETKNLKVFCNLIVFDGARCLKPSCGRCLKPSYHSERFVEAG